MSEAVTFLYVNSTGQIWKMGSTKVCPTYQMCLASTAYRLCNCLTLLNPIYCTKFSSAVLNDGKVIGSISVLIEKKFIHNCGKVAHIEDVVTRKGYEGIGIRFSFWWKGRLNFRPTLAVIRLFWIVRKVM